MRVAFPAHLAGLDPRSGDGKMWTRVLAGLAQRGELSLHPSPGRLRRLARRPDVWLGDALTEPPPVAGRVVLQAHEAPWGDPEQRALMDPAFLAAMEAGMERCVPLADLVLTGAQSARRELVATYGLAPERVRVIAHGVDRDCFNSRAEGGVEMVARALGGRARPYVLFVSTVHPRKNLGALRGAMERLVGRGMPHALVLVAGPAADRADSSRLLAAATAQLEAAPRRVVHMADATDAEVAALMAGAAAFCLPSIGEGFGLTALEAMSCGAPVVAGDRGALPELVGDAGMLVAPRTEDLTAALVAVLSDADLAARLGAAGARRAAGFTWEATVRGWLAALLEVAER